MNVEKRGIILGMALGDGYVQVRQRLNKGKYPYESRTMRVVHGPDQRIYCEWKARRLAWALGRKQINVTKQLNNKKYDSYSFTVSHPYFKQVRGWFYPNGVRMYTRRILDMLTPEGVAIWYMDDGSARRNTNTKGFVSSVSTNIATMCSEAEVVVIRDWFKDRFDVVFKVRCNKRCTPGKQFFIECNTAESRKFCSIIQPHIHESMLYKLAHVATLSSQECQTPVGTCECGKPIFEARRGGKCSACYSRSYYQKVRRHREGRTPRG